MNAISQAKRAYLSTSAPTKTPKSVEYDVVARITHKIRSANQKGNAGFASLVEALHENRQLWTIFATDVADSTNALPADLKARLFYLAEFTLQHTEQVLAGKASVLPLLEINTAVMGGLREGGV